MNATLFRHAFVLILLALLGAFFIPSMMLPRLGLSAHTIGLLSGALLIAIGAIWSSFALSAVQGLVMQWTWIYSSYANWLGCLIGAVFGAGSMTPVATEGFVGSGLVEGVVTALLVSVGLTSLVAVGLSLWGLRPQVSGTPRAS